MPGPLVDPMLAQQGLRSAMRFDPVEVGAERLVIMLGFLVRAALVALGLWGATVWVQGVEIDSPSTLILAGLLLGVVNSIVRAIAMLLTLPMTVATLGLFLLVINAGMVGLVAWMIPGMHVAGFWSAMWTA